MMQDSLPGQSAPPPASTPPTASPPPALPPPANPIYLAAMGLILLVMVGVGVWWGNNATPNSNRLVELGTLAIISLAVTVVLALVGTSIGVFRVAQGSVKGPAAVFLLIFASLNTGVWVSSKNTSESWVLSGEIVGFPKDKQGQFSVAGCPQAIINSDGHFDVKVGDWCLVNPLPISIKVPGYEVQRDAPELSAVLAKRKWYEVNFTSKQLSMGLVAATTPTTPTTPTTATTAPITATVTTPTAATPPEEIDYIDQRVEGVEGCGPPVGGEDANILATATYKNASMEPTLYGTPYRGITISHEANQQPTFYRVKVANQCYLHEGDTHGGFYYLIDTERTPINKTYKISFCAWSINADGLGLRIQHSNGLGEVSNLSRTAILTKNPRRFTWQARLDGYVLGKQQNTPQRYLFGYLADYVKKKACDLDNPDKFAGKEFVIGDVKLEMLPDSMSPK